jgi:hypothetical protein
MNRKLYLYFHKFLKPLYDFHGLTLKPNFLPNEELIRWSVENPQDKSYTMETLIAFTEELFLTFCNLVGSSELYYQGFGSSFYRENRKNACSFEQPDNYYYINKSDDQKILDSIKQITKIDYKKVFYSDVECTYVNIYPSEDFTVTIGIKLLNPHNKQHSKLINTGLKDTILELVEDSDFYGNYVYDLFSPVLNIIRNRPLLFSDEWMYFTPDIIFIDKNNKIIRLYS